MAQRTFDSLRYARSLKDVGVPEEQAEVMAEALGIFAENLVSREYLDLRLSELEARMETKLIPIQTKLARHDLMLAAIFVAVVIPLVRDFVG